MTKLKLISWNVNGIRAGIRKGFVDTLGKMDPDVIGIQETKAMPEQVDMFLPSHPHMYWNSAERKGYSGTAIFSKIKPLSVIKGIGIKKHDDEGRVLTAEFESFYFVTVYTPNSKDDLARLPYRYNEWDKEFLKFVKKLEKKKPVVFCGDLNVAHKEIDLARPKANMTTEKKPGNKGFTDQEREGFDNIIKAGFIDTFRHLNPDTTEAYSWWSQMGGARARNVGWRIDYVCISPSLEKGLKEAFILPEVMGSDHCPVGITLQVD